MRCIFLSEKSVERAWLKAILSVLDKGIPIKTEYDNPDDPSSKDATIMIEITDAIAYPMQLRNKTLSIKSKYGTEYMVFGHPSDLWLIESIKSGYIEEMLNGINDHLILESKSSFPYTYHDRLYKYTAYGEEDKDKSIDPCFPKGKLSHINLPKMNQIEDIIDKLKESPYSRRAQGITWRPYSDPFHSNPPCLQRVWCRIWENKLYMQTTWRSRDLFKAWSSNVNAMIRLQHYIAGKLDVDMGTYVDISNSLHIYGKDMKELIKLLTTIYSRKDYSYKEKGLFFRVLLKLQETDEEKQEFFSLFLK